MLQAVLLPRFVLHRPTFLRWSWHKHAAEDVLCQFIDCDKDATPGEGRALCSLHRSLVEELESPAAASSMSAVLMVPAPYAFDLP